MSESYLYCSKCGKIVSHNEAILSLEVDPTKLAIISKTFLCPTCGSQLEGQSRLKEEEIDKILKTIRNPPTVYRPKEPETQFCRVCGKVLPKGYPRLM